MSRIFKKYDIRGVYPQEINEELFYELGKAIGTFFGENKTIVVARDVRLSSKSLKFNLIHGLVEVGVNVIDVDLVPTPTFHFLVHYFGADGGAMVTASHNPPEYNGIKLCGDDLIPIGLGNGLEKIEEIFKTKKYSVSSRSGSVKQIENPILPHLDFLLGKASKISKTVRIVADLGNGSACEFFKSLVRRMENVECVLLNDEFDGSFPNRSPEPKEENITELINEVKCINADFGVAFDGDSDRIVFVDDKGRVLSGDWVLTVFAKYLLPKSDNKKVVGEVTCTNMVKKIVNELGGEYIESVVGRRFIIEKMKNDDCFLGGEVSSHFYFKSTNYVDDSYYAFITMIGVIDGSGKKLSQIIDEIGFPIKSKFSVRVKNDEEKSTIIEKIKEKFSSYPHEEKDGIKVFFDEMTWVVARPSNTEPIVKFVIESYEEAKINEIKKSILEILK